MVHVARENSARIARQSLKPGESANCREQRRPRSPRSSSSSIPATLAVAGRGRSSVPQGPVCFGLAGPQPAPARPTHHRRSWRGFLPPTAGEGAFITPRASRSANRFFARKPVSFFQEETALQDFLTVRQSIALFRGLYTHGNSTSMRSSALCALEKLAGARQAASSPAAQQQRLLLANRRLVNEPRGYCSWMKPTTGLDPQGTPRNFLGADAVDQGAAQEPSILTTHYMEEAELLCDEIVIMDPRPHHRPGPRRGACCTSTSRRCCWSCHARSFPAAARASCPSISSTRADRVEISTHDLEAHATHLAGGEKCPLTNPAHPAGQPRGPVSWN